MKFNFMDYRYTFFAFSGFLFVASLLLLMFNGLNYGIDFKGGNIIQLRFVEPITEGKIREIFGKMNNLYFKPDQLVIQAVAESQGTEFIIQYPAPAVDTADVARVHSQILKDLKDAAPYHEDARRVSNVGPTVGAEMKNQGIKAAVISVIGILLYLAYRFEFQSATGTVIALIHDLFITMGVISILNLEFDITVLAALLTLLGYSCNDSIVVLDRIRENRKLMRETSFANIINESINQTLGRTINTSLTTLFSLIALLMLGGIAIRGFAITLTVGCVIGTYSSIFLASPILLTLTGDKLGKRAKKSA